MGGYLCIKGLIARHANKATTHLALADDSETICASRRICKQRPFDVLRGMKRAGVDQALNAGKLSMHCLARMLWLSSLELDDFAAQAAYAHSGD